MIDRTRTLIIGGSGMVGSQIDFGIKPSHAELDITDATSVEKAIRNYEPTAVLLLAGLVDIKRCEENPEEAERVNTQGAVNVADACGAGKIPLVYFSSCMVFDGEKAAPYDESDTPRPLNVYGDTKYRGEQEVLKRAPEALVVRTGWLFGGDEHDTKFVRRFYGWLQEGRSFSATSDRFGSPTYVPDLIAETMRLLQKGERGIFHVVNDGIASYFDVAQELNRLTGLSAAITAASSKELDVSGVPRGRMEGLVSERGVALRPYQDALAEYVAMLRANGYASRNE